MQFDKHVKDYELKYRVYALGDAVSRQNLFFRPAPIFFAPSSRPRRPALRMMSSHEPGPPNPDSGLSNGRRRPSPRRDATQKCRLARVCNACNYSMTDSSRYAFFFV